MSTMTTLTIPDVEERMMELLKKRAERNGRSVTDEVRGILRSNLGVFDPNRQNVVKVARECFGPIGGLELERPPADLVRDPPDFS